MKIVHLNDAYYPTIGGLERSVKSLSDWQVQAGHEVYVVTGEHPDAPQRETSTEGIHIIRYKMISQIIPGLLENPERPFHPTFKDPITAKQLEKIFLEINPDIIHAHGWSMYSAVNIAKKHHIPFLATAHDYGYFCAVKQNLLGGKECSNPSLGKCLRHSAEHYGALKGIPISLGLRSNVKTNNSVSWSGLSSSVKEAATGSSYQVDNMSVISSMCPDNILDPIVEPKPEFTPDEDYACFVGGLYNEKGVGLLLKAQQELITEGTIIPLVLVGMLKSDSPDLNLPHVYYSVNQPHNVVMSAWKHAAVGVIPSVLPEAFGQVAVECIAAGTPAIAARHGGLVDIIEEGIQGLLFTPNNIEDLKTKLKKLWNDKKLQETMGSRGPERAARFIVSSVAPDIMSKYDEVISGVK